MASAFAASDEPRTLARLRRILWLTLVLGVAGMGTELLLIGHVDGVFQITPLVLLGCGLAALVWHTVRPHAVSIRAVRTLMTLFVVSGLAGTVLHFQGNRAFELEMYPEMSGIVLVFNTLTGATPVLAPGSMTLLGIVGLAATYGEGARPQSGIAN